MRACKTPLQEFRGGALKAMPRETNLLSGGSRCTQAGPPMHYIVVPGVIYCGVMPPAGLRYRSQIGRRVPARRYDARETFHPFYTTFFLAVAVAAARAAKRERKREKRREERDRQRARAREEKLRLIAYRPFVSKVELPCKAQFLRGRFVGQEYRERGSRRSLSLSRRTCA